MLCRRLLLSVLFVFTGCGEDKKQEETRPKPRDADASVETDPIREDTDKQNIDEAASEETAEDCIDSDEFICAIEIAVTRYSNELRLQSSPLTHHGRLSYTARVWSNQQASSGSISHNGFPSARVKTYTAAFPGDKINILAENVAMTTSGATSADAVARLFVNMWANSPGHRRNILGNYRVLGVGIARKGNVFYATQIFGTE